MPTPFEGLSDVVSVCTIVWIWICIWFDFPEAVRFVSEHGVMSSCQTAEEPLEHPVHELLPVLVQELKPKTKIGISGQFDATNPNTKPKVGFAFDLKN